MADCLPKASESATPTVVAVIALDSSAVIDTAPDVTTVAVRTVAETAGGDRVVGERDAERDAGRRGALARADRDSHRVRVDRAVVGARPPSAKHPR